MSTTFGIIINQEYIPVARRSNGLIIIKNPLVLLLPKHVNIINDNSDKNILTAGDLQEALSKQTLLEQSPNNILREDIISNDFIK